MSFQVSMFSFRRLLNGHRRYLALLGVTLGCGRDLEFKFWVIVEFLIGQIVSLRPALDFGGRLEGINWFRFLKATEAGRMCIFLK